jgi:hypothetical protein
LAKRFKVSAKTMNHHTGDDPFAHWFVGEDVNRFGSDDELIQWPCFRSASVNVMDPGVPGLMD